MLALRSPAVDEEWWERMLSIVIELQERRAKGVAQRELISPNWRRS